eukprot:scaffold7403_cov390-Prasinococcus_capsulatus_cf.AAC.2
MKKAIQYMRRSCDTWSPRGALGGPPGKSLTEPSVLVGANPAHRSEVEPNAAPQLAAVHHEGFRASRCAKGSLSAKEPVEKTPPGRYFRLDGRCGRDWRSTERGEHPTWLGAVVAEPAALEEVDCGQRRVVFRVPLHRVKHVRANRPAARSLAVNPKMACDDLNCEIGIGFPASQCGRPRWPQARPVGLNMNETAALTESPRRGPRPRPARGGAGARDMLLVLALGRMQVWAPRWLRCRSFRAGLRPRRSHKPPQEEPGRGSADGGPSRPLLLSGMTKERFPNPCPTLLGRVTAAGASRQGVRGGASVTGSEQCPSGPHARNRRTRLSRGYRLLICGAASCTLRCGELRVGAAAGPNAAVYTASVLVAIRPLHGTAL